MPIQELDNMESLLGEVADEFGDVMKQVFDEDPKIFEGHSTKATWNAQVDAASDAFYSEIKNLVEQFEIRLHQGEFGSTHG